MFMLNQKKIWDNSHKKKDNFLLYPSENVVRFFNKYIHKNKEFKPNKKNIKVLDLGCGAGRHLVFFAENKCDIIGYDISTEAIKCAKQFLNFRKIKKFILLDSLNSRHIKDNDIDVIVSHGVLDSMAEKDAKKYIAIAKLKLKKQGLFYVEVLGKKTSKPEHIKSTRDTYIIKHKHEYNTFQTCYDDNKIKNLFKKFSIIEKYTVTQKNKKSIHEMHILIMKNS